MIPCRRNILRGFAVIGVALCAGCGSPQFNGLGPVVNKAVVQPIMEPLRDLERGANEFRVAQGRWPGDFPELTDFLKQSDGETCRQLHAAQLSHIEFSDAPNGWLKVTGLILLPAGTYTASGSSLTVSGGTVTLTMTMAPIDPQEMRDGANPKSENTN